MLLVVVVVDSKAFLFDLKWGTTSSKNPIDFTLSSSCSRGYGKANKIRRNYYWVISGILEDSRPRSTDSPQCIRPTSRRVVIPEYERQIDLWPEPSVTNTGTESESGTDAQSHQWDSLSQLGFMHSISTVANCHYSKLTDSSVPFINTPITVPKTIPVLWEWHLLKFSVNGPMKYWSFFRWLINSRLSSLSREQTPKTIKSATRLTNAVSWLGQKMAN